jgi:hypothetical protein
MREAWEQPFGGVEWFGFLGHGFTDAEVIIGFLQHISYRLLDSDRAEFGFNLVCVCFSVVLFVCLYVYLLAFENEILSILNDTEHAVGW